jgi:hypothetical protein
LRGGQSGGRLEDCGEFPAAPLGRGSRVVVEDGIEKRISCAMQIVALAANPVSSCPRFVRFCHQTLCSVQQKQIGVFPQLMMSFPPSFSPAPCVSHDVESRCYHLTPSLDTSPCPLLSPVSHFSGLTSLTGAQPLSTTSGDSSSRLDHAELLCRKTQNHTSHMILSTICRHSPP